MSKISKTGHDNYKLIVNSGGSITLDTGVDLGTVFITGNLEVAGEFTKITSTDTQITDNILQLNFGQTGNGISGTFDYQSGIQIARGDYPDSYFVFDESVIHYDPLTNQDVSGTFVLKSDNQLNGLSVNTIASPNLCFDLRNASKALSIVNVTNYETYVIHDNDIPNKKYMEGYVVSGGLVPGMADVTAFYDKTGTAITSRGQAVGAELQFYIDETLRSKIDVTGLTVDNINLFNNTISNTSTNSLVLTSASNKVEIDSILSLVNLTTVGETLIHSDSPNTGNTGIFVTNVNTSDELIAKNRALLFSMIF